jgi:hypothetical protein
MAGIRPLVESDVATVADLIWNVLHGHSGSAPSSLRFYVQDLFLQNPWKAEDIVSRVYEDSSGKIAGFFGAVPRRMSLQGNSVRLAFGSNFVMAPESRSSMAGIQLVRTFMKGTQDVSITDSANENSRQLLRSLGFQVLPIYSLHWTRPLRPSEYALHTLSRINRSRVIRALGTFARPFCNLADTIATGLNASPFRQRRLQGEDKEPDVQTLLQCISTIPAKNWMVPEYDLHSLNWVLDFIIRRKALGELRRGLVRRNEKIVGWYIYGIGQNSIGEVLQIGAETSSVGIVLDHLFYDAWKRGLVGLQGRMEPQFMEELTARMCFFFRHGSWTLAHSSKPELLSLFQSGTMFFSRLDGEWCLRHGDRQSEGSFS